MKLLKVLMCLFVIVAGGCTKPAEPADATPTATPEEQTETTEKCELTLMDYDVYQPQDLSFRFIIAKIRVRTDDKVNVSLSHFRTGEGIQLDQISEYVNELEARSYYLGRQNVVYELVSDDSTYMANIFIPVKDKNAKTINVIVDFMKEPLTFDLSKTADDANMFVYHPDEVISDGETYEMTVSKAFDITGEYMYSNNDMDQEYYLPSTCRTYIFTVKALSLKGDEIIIDSATYVPQGSKETFEALPQEVNSMKHRNILGKTITENGEGDLFFVAFNPDFNPITYTGVLNLKLHGSDDVIAIQVDLN